MCSSEWCALIQTRALGRRRARTVWIAPRRSRPRRRAAGQGVGQFVVGGEDVFGPRHCQLPGLGQHHLAAAAVEQCDLEFVLEGLDVQAHGRRGEAEQVGGPGESAVAGDGHQGAQGFEGHANGLRAAREVFQSVAERNGWQAAQSHSLRGKETRLTPTLEKAHESSPLHRLAGLGRSRPGRANGGIEAGRYGWPGQVDRDHQHRAEQVRHRAHPDLKDLPPGVHGFHLHQKGSCAAAEENGKAVPAGAAGGHWDPDATNAHKGPTTTAATGVTCRRCMSVPTARLPTQCWRHA